MAPVAVGKASESDRGAVKWVRIGVVQLGDGMVALLESNQAIAQPARVFAVTYPQAQVILHSAMADLRAALMEREIANGAEERGSDGNQA